MVGLSESTLKKRAEKAFFQQHDQSDCGVACLASIVHFLEGEVTLERLRELSGTTKQGTTLLGLYQAADNIGLQAEAYKADLENLKEQADPCILHIIKEGQLQHYVIYYGFENNRFLISDPGVGIVSYAPGELERVWQSKALLLVKPKETFKTVDEKKKTAGNG